MLIAAGADVKVANRDGSTPLWLASTNGDAATIRALLDAGADANETLPLGRTPLMLASRTGAVEAMRVLIDRGANLNAQGYRTRNDTHDVGGRPGSCRGCPASHRTRCGPRRSLGSRRARKRARRSVKSSDPRTSVRRQVEAIIAEQKELPDLSQLRERRS